MGLGPGLHKVGFKPAGAASDGMFEPLVSSQMQGLAMTPRQTSARTTGSESASAGPAAADRRRHPRTACEIDAKVTEVTDGTPGSNWPAKVVDLSRGGAGLRCQHKATVGIDVLIELRGDGAALGQLLFGTVRHTREAQPGEYSVGVEFRAVPNTPAIRAWQARRRSLR